MTRTNVSQAEQIDIFKDGQRQLAICNACRYCAGYCPVWPNVERHVEMSFTEMEELANLCHDCRDCYTACMYTPPHEFNLNIPKLFTQIREYTYDKYTWPRHIPAALRGFKGLVAVFVAMLVVLFAAGALTGADDWLTTDSGDVYRVLGHWSIIILMSGSVLYSLIVTFSGLARFYRSIKNEHSKPFSLAQFGKTFVDVMAMRNMTGGEEGCSYIENQPTLMRKVGHQFLMYGFLGTFLATCSAAIFQYVLGWLPPYDFLSLPVILGSLGGISALVGGIMLISIKGKSDSALTTSSMYSADQRLILGLLAIMLTGFLVTLFRYTPAFPVLFIVHIACVGTGFLVFPKTKFVHLFFRTLAIYQDNLEVEAHLKKLASSKK